MRPFLSHKNGPTALTAALKDEDLNADVAKLALRATGAAAVDVSALQDALRAAGKLSAAQKKYSAEEIAALVADVKAKGDPHRGEAIYRRAGLQCMKCHAVGGAGGKVGPDLVSVGTSAQVDYLIESLVDLVTTQIRAHEARHGQAGVRRISQEVEIGLPSCGGSGN